MGRINEKTKIIAASIALLIGIALIAAASYAWASISKQPEVSGIHMNVSTSDILEIAAVTSDNIETGPPEVGTSDLSIGQGTWGKDVDLSGTKIILQAPATGDPEVGLGTVTYDANGRTNGIKPLEKDAAPTDGIIYYTCPVGPAEYYVNQEGNIVKAVTGNEKYSAAGSVAVWLRSNKTSPVRLDISNLSTEGAENVPVGIAVRVMTYNAPKGSTPTPEGEPRLVMLDKSRSDYIIDNVFSSEHPIEPNKIYMVEIIYYVEGDLTAKNNAIIASKLTNPVVIKTAEMSFSRME